MRRRRIEEALAIKVDVEECVATQHRMVVSTMIGLNGEERQKQ